MGTCEVNKKLLPLKASYFLYFAGLACMHPYLPVYFVSLGIAVWQVGLLRGIDPILNFVCSPIWGGLADKFSKHRLLLTVATIGTCVLYFLLMFVSYIAPSPTPQPMIGQVDCIKESFLAEGTTCSRLLTTGEWMDPISKSLCEQACITADGTLSSEKTIGICSSVKVDGIDHWRCLKCGTDFDEGAEDGSQSDVYPLELIHCQSPLNETLLHRSLKVINENMSIDRPFDLLSLANDDVCSLASASCCECNIPPAGQTSNHHAFIICFVLILLGNTFDCNILPYLDAAIMDVLGTDDKNFGKQRMWGAVSWGLVAFGGGLAVDAVTRASGLTGIRYEPLFVIFGIAMILFLFVTFFIQLPSHKRPQHMSRDLLVILRKPALVMFLLVLVFEGAALAITYSFVMIYWQQELGASITLLGLSILMSVVSETPILFVSGWIVERIGYRGVIYSTLAAYSLRFLCYGLIRNPWAVLPVQLLNGITFGVGWPGFTMYANQLAPEGMTTTLQSLKSSAFGGVGFLLGNFIGGAVYQRYGPRILFLGTAVLCVVIAVFFSVMDWVIGGVESRDHGHTQPEDTTSGDVPSPNENRIV